ncbi:MAG TPA: CAP domain-containing protein, partial [Candidatus Binataceae bacterium]|nr:CAP domain-containing protein [Candidatus Binataceae bacterium]
DVQARHSADGARRGYEQGNGDRRGASAAAVAADRAWLTPLNHYRQLAGLPPVAPDPTLAAGDLAHARYLVKTDAENISKGWLGPEAHVEDLSSPWYSHAGQIAAAGSDVEAGANPYGKPWITPEGAIDGWISTPFHRLAILNPLLQAAGYGQYCDGGSCAAALNLLTDMAPIPLMPKMLPKPIMFPPDGSSLPLKQWEGEWPDPLTSCPGYTAPSGLAITLQLGLSLATNLAQFKVMRGSGTPSAIEACGFASGSYVNPDPATQARGRHIMTNMGAVIIVPRKPLQPGHYTVALTANDRPYAWSFTISP